MHQASSGQALVSLCSNDGSHSNCFHISLPETFRPARVNCNGCRNPLGSGPRQRPRRFHGACAEAPLGWTVGGLPPALPTLGPLARAASGPGAGPRPAHRSPDPRTRTSPTSMGLVLPGPSLAPELWLRAVEAGEEPPANGQPYGNPATYLRLRAGAEQGQERSSGWFRALRVKCGHPSPQLCQPTTLTWTHQEGLCCQPPVGSTCRSFHVIPPGERSRSPTRLPREGLSPWTPLLPRP